MGNCHFYDPQKKGPLLNDLQRPFNIKFYAFGKKADFLLLDDEPLIIVSRVRGIHKVMLNGVWVENNEDH